MRRLALVPALAAAALLAVTGCSASADGDDVVVGTDELPVDSGSGTLHDCMLGVWELDGARNAVQLQDHFVANGTAITSTTVEGGVTLTIDEHLMSYNSGITYTMAGDIGGLELVIAQHQVGVSEGRWTETDGIVTFSDWEPGIAVTNTVTLAGTESDLGVVFPEDYGTGVPMDVYCSGDELETTPNVSPFTGYWTRVG